MIAVAWRNGLVGVMIVLVSLGVSTGLAQDWARAMLDHATHDFGVVARGAKVEHRFIVENIYEEDAHIQSVSSSCGCSTPQVSRQLLKTWEKAEILVTLDTRGFLGRKDATIRVELDKPFPAEIQLHVHAYIRSDIVVQPGAVQFGSIAQGASAKQGVSISYAGRDDWKIERVECANSHIEANVVETSRTPGLVSYSLSVRLKEDAPPGYLREPLVLVTNDSDPKSARVPVPVEGLVVAALSVRPSPLMMGVAEPDQPVTRNLVVQGRMPFRITAIRSSDDRFQCNMKMPSESKTAHVIPVTFLARQANVSKDAAENSVCAKIRIETDLIGANVVEVGVSAQRKPAASAKP